MPGRIARGEEESKLTPPVFAVELVADVLVLNVEGLDNLGQSPVAGQNFWLHLGSNRDTKEKQKSCRAQFVTYRHSGPTWIIGRERGGKEDQKRYNSMEQ